MTINTISDFRSAIRNGPYAWPGGYPLYFVTADGAALSFEAAKQERRNILEALRDNDVRSGWRVAGVDVNWEDAELYCDHTGQPIAFMAAKDGLRGVQATRRSKTCNPLRARAGGTATITPHGPGSFGSAAFRCRSASCAPIGTPFVNSVCAPSRPLSPNVQPRLKPHNPGAYENVRLCCLARSY